MITTKKLVITFLTGVGRKVSLSIDDPREDLSESDVVDAMNLILKQNIFNLYGNDFKSTVEANVICTDATTEYDLSL